MEPKVQRYAIRVDDIGDFDLDEDRSIAPSIQFALKQAGIEASVDQDEFNRAGVEISTTATQNEVETALQRDEIEAEVSMMEDNEQYVKTGPGHFKQDDFTTSVKKQKRFKYVPAKHGDNGLADEDKQTKETKESQERFDRLMSEYKEFVAESSDQKKRLK